MSRILLVLIVGLLLIATVGGIYYAYVGFDKPFSTSGEDWGQFGDYFGGVSSALLAFISILLLVYTIHLQSEQLSGVQHEMLKRDLLAHVTKADDEIMHWLERELAALKSGETVEFGDVVWGILEPNYINPKEFKLATVRLHKLTCLYCEALALYRDNIDPHFIFKYHHQKAQSLLNFLKDHQKLLDRMAGPSLQFCQMHLDGKHEV
ncbi:hypothetical protein SAMN05216379_12626 [Nitrosomonas eutropha]|uniref:Phage abortive infection protein n=1 Tax=Nitrosomonas eutropha TaxID=916 RepID=A0A1G4WLJ9_9PROT|nr:hypothetical protein [Nitrosomonas eutropha]SCX25210.1 hypothetical protein SAMN05216379_12626 [Nitrosomonas eutropha]SFU27381.1 hypothetical protein SAMN05216339_10120 [Nitrosomonas eutropha]